jgi:hypothetical protein
MTSLCNREFCEKVMVRIGKHNDKNFRSSINGVSEFCHLLNKSKEMISQIQTKFQNPNTCKNKISALSKIMAATTVEERKQFINLHHEMNMSDEQVNKIFENQILCYYKSKNPEQRQADRDVQDAQEMTQDDLDNYVPFEEIIEKLSVELPKINVKNVVEKQMIIALALMVKCDIILRGDIGELRINNIQKDSKIWLQKDQIFVAESNKTKRSFVIQIPDDVMEYVNMLKTVRISRGEDYLFMKIGKETPFTGPGNIQLTETKAGNPTCEWFCGHFGDKMMKLFKNRRLTISRVRQSVGIYLSTFDTGDLQYQRQIEKRMDHCYSIHQRFYNRYKSLISK